MTKLQIGLLCSLFAILLNSCNHAGETGVVELDCKGLVFAHSFDTTVFGSEGDSIKYFMASNQADLVYVKMDRGSYHSLPIPSTQPYLRKIQQEIKDKDFKLDSSTMKTRIYEASRKLYSLVFGDSIEIILSDTLLSILKNGVIIKNKKQYYYTNYIRQDSTSTHLTLGGYSNLDSLINDVKCVLKDAL